MKFYILCFLLLWQCKLNAIDMVSTYNRALAYSSGSVKNVLPLKRIANGVVGPKVGKLDPSNFVPNSVLYDYIDMHGDATIGCAEFKAEWHSYIVAVRAASSYDRMKLRLLADGDARLMVFVRYSESQYKTEELTKFLTDRFKFDGGHANDLVDHVVRYNLRPSAGSKTSLLLAEQIKKMVVNDIKLRHIMTEERLYNLNKTLEEHTAKRNYRRQHALY